MRSMSQAFALRAPTPAYAGGGADSARVLLAGERSMAGLLAWTGRLWQPAPRGLNHVARTVDTGNRCSRIARRQHFGGIAGTAPQVNYRMRLNWRQRGEQIAHGPRAFIFEGNVLFGGPTQFNPDSQVITMLSRAMRRSE